MKNMRKRKKINSNLYIFFKNNKNKNVKTSILTTNSINLITGSSCAYKKGRFRRVASDFTERDIGM